MKFIEILNENAEVINEGALTDLLTSVFKGFKRTVGASAEVLLQKSLNDVAQGGKKVALSALRKNASYQEALKTTVAEASRVKFQKSFLELNKNEAQKLVNEVQSGMEKELAERAALSKTIIDADVKGATSMVGKTQKGVNAGKMTQQDLAAATKELIANTKLQTKYADMQKVIAGMDKLSAKKVADLIKKDAKVISGTGGSIAGGVKGNTQIITKRGIFTITKEQLSKFPGNVKRVIVNNPVKSALIAAGLSIAALYYFFGDDNVILTDENGNDVPDISGGWAPCIQELLTSKEGAVAKTSNGQLSVIVKPTDFPGGIQFYNNGRVMDVVGKKMGTWKCKGTKAVIAETQKISLIGLLNEQGDATTAADVKTMIDLLDFPVSGGDLTTAGNLLQKYVDNGKGKDFLSLYQQSGIGGGDLTKTLNYIVTTEPTSVQAKNRLKQLNAQILSGKGGQPKPNTGGKKGLGGIDITWDGQKKTDDKPSGGGTKKSRYHDCSGKDTFEFGCKSPKIREIQKCLGMEERYQTGNFGPLTKKALEDMSYDTSQGITVEMYNRIKSTCTDNSDVRAPRLDGSIEPLKTNLTPKSAPVNADNLKLPNLQPVGQGNRGESIYNGLKNNFNDKTLPYIFSSGGRIKYKGDDLGDDVLGQLDQYIGTLGYQRIKEKDKDYGVKYVWAKQ
jgi:hypothetical protein